MKVIPLHPDGVGRPPIDGEGLIWAELSFREIKFVVLSTDDGFYHLCYTLPNNEELKEIPTDIRIEAKLCPPTHFLALCMPIITETWLKAGT